MRRDGRKAALRKTRVRLEVGIRVGGYVMWRIVLWQVSLGLLHVVRLMIVGLRITRILGIVTCRRLEIMRLIIVGGYVIFRSVTRRGLRETMRLIIVFRSVTWRGLRETMRLIIIFGSVIWRGLLEIMRLVIVMRRIIIGTI